MSDRGWSWPARIVVGALSAAVIAVAASVPAPAASIFEKNGYMIGPRFDSYMPTCDDGLALATIQSRFSSKESSFWNSNLTIVEFDQIKEVAYRPWADATIPRRFCTGRALISDGTWRPIRYHMIEDGGMIGGVWGVQWCVVGLDRNWANNPDCRQAGP